MSRHGKHWLDDPINMDWEGNWDGVQFHYGRQCFVRYLDRNGERVEEIRA